MSLKKVYVLVGNLWLLLGVVVALGGKVMRGGPTMLSFFGVGRWFYPATYNFIVFCCILVGVVFLVAAWRRPDDI